MDILTTNVQDLVIAVEDQIDKRIWDILTESQSAVNINTNASTAAWDAASGQDPVEDVMEALQEIREQTKIPAINEIHATVKILEGVTLIFSDYPNVEDAATTDSEQELLLTRWAHNVRYGLFAAQLPPNN